MGSLDTRFKFFTFCLFAIAAAQARTLRHRTEGQSQEISSDERRDLRKLFKTSSEMEEAGLHEEVASQQFILKETKVVLNKADEIMDTSQDSTDADSVFPEIKTQEYKSTLPVSIEHGVMNSVEKLTGLLGDNESTKKHLIDTKHKAHEKKYSSSKMTAEWTKRKEHDEPSQGSEIVISGKLVIKPDALSTEEIRSADDQDQVCTTKLSSLPDPGVASMVDKPTPRLLKPSHDQQHKKLIKLSLIPKDSSLGKIEASSPISEEQTHTDTTDEIPAWEKAFVAGKGEPQLFRAVEPPTRGDLPTIIPDADETNNRLYNLQGRGINNHLLPQQNSATQALIPSDSTEISTTEGPAIVGSQGKTPEKVSTETLENANEPTSEGSSSEAISTTPKPESGEGTDVNDIGSLNPANNPQISGNQQFQHNPFARKSMPRIEVRNGIVPLAQPYVILTGPVVFSNRQRRQRVLPAFLFNFQKPAPAYMSFGKSWSGGFGGNEVVDVDDPKLTKEEFFRDPDSALKNFKSEFLHHSNGSATDVLSRMSIDAADLSRHFPLSVFKNMETNRSNNPRSSTNVFDFIKSLQPPARMKTRIFFTS